MWKGGPARKVGELLGELEGEEAQLVLSYLIWPGECPDPRVVDEWVRREEGQAAALTTPLQHHFVGIS